LGGFYLVAVGVGGIANILAYGIMQMEGVGGIRGWQWIFILEGILTCIVAIGAWFIILDFPDRAAKQGFLNEREANFVLRRIEEDRGDSEADPLTWAKFFKHLSDLKLWAFCTLFMSTTVPVYAFAYALSPPPFRKSVLTNQPATSPPLSSSASATPLVSPTRSQPRPPSSP
jgi:sugar phosphate permease